MSDPLPEEYWKMLLEEAEGQYESSSVDSVLLCPPFRCPYTRFRSDPDLDEQSSLSASDEERREDRPDYNPYCRAED